MTPANILRSLRSQEIGLSIVLAIQASIIFVIGPLAATGVVSILVMDVCRVGLAAAAALLLTRSRVMSLLVVGAFLISAALSTHHGSGAIQTATSYLRQAATAAFDLAVGAVVAQMAFAPGRVTVHRIMGAVILYLSIGLLFSNAFRACAMSLSGAFNGLSDARGGISQLLYFSLSTLTTAGYGDIVPVHPFVRSLSNLEAVIGQLFPATLLARLVTLHATPGNADRAESGGPGDPP